MGSFGRGFLSKIRSCVARLAYVSLTAAQIAACDWTKEPIDGSPPVQSTSSGALTVVVDYYAERDRGPGAGIEWEASRRWELLDAYVGDCVARQISQAHRARTIIPATVFRRTAFPNLTDMETPRSRESLLSLLDNAIFRARIAPLGLRYIVVVSGGETTSTRGGIICGAADRYGACFGMITWDKDAKLAATIFDLDKAAVAAAPANRTSGTAWLAVIGVFPLGFPYSPTQTSCGQLGMSVAAAISAWEAGEVPVKPR